MTDNLDLSSDDKQSDSTDDTETRTHDADARNAPEPEAAEPESEPETHAILEDHGDGDGEDAAPGTEELREQGRQEAQRFLEDAEGESRYERVGDALANLRDQYKTLQQQRQQIEQQHDSLETKRDELADTIEQVEAVDGERDILVTYEGGVTIPKPPEEHDAVIAELTDTRESLRERCEALAGKLSTVERTAQKAEFAMQQLQEYRTTLSDFDGL